MESPNLPTSDKSTNANMDSLATKDIATDQNFSEPYIGPFCDKCKVVQFDDQEQGGQVISNGPGEQYVSFQKARVISLVYEQNDTLPGLPALSVSAQNGCRLCGLFKDFILRCVRMGWSREGLAEGRVCVKNLEFELGKAAGRWQFPRNGGSLQGLRFRLQISTNGESEWMGAYFAVDAEPGMKNRTITITWTALTSTGPCATWLNIGRRPISPHALSKPGAQRLTELVNTHVERNPTTYEREFLPTRLIYVGQTGDSLRLMETHNREFDVFRHGSKSRYVALSKAPHYIHFHIWFFSDGLHFK